MRTVRLAGALLAICPLIYPRVSFADANDYVATPIVVEGEKEIDFKWGAQRLRNGTSGTATSIGLGWGPTAWWFTEFYAKYKRDPGASNAFDAWEFENKFQLTETGRYPVDVGFLLHRHPVRFGAIHNQNYRKLPTDSADEPEILTPRVT